MSIGPDRSGRRPLDAARMSEYRAVSSSCVIACATAHERPLRIVGSSLRSRLGRESREQLHRAGPVSKCLFAFAAERCRCSCAACTTATLGWFSLLFDAIESSMCQISRPAPGSWES